MRLFFNSNSFLAFFGKNQRLYNAETLYIEYAYLFNNNMALKY